MQVHSGQSFHFPWFPFRGIITPVFTPFDKDQNINFPVIRNYAEYLHTSGITGILVNGTTGEGISLTVEERKAILEAWVREAQQFNITVMVHVGGTNLKDVKSLAQHAEKYKAAALLCIADLFYKPTNLDELIRYLNCVSSAAPRTPLLYYHIPSYTGININAKKLMERITEVPTLVGLKFTDNDIVLGSSCVTDKTKEYAVFLGCDSLCLPALMLGFNSTIAASSNVFPTYLKQIFKFFNSKDYEKAAKAQNALNNRIQQILAYGPWVSSMKAAMRKFTPVDVGPVRDPLVQVNLDDVKFTFS